MGNFLSSDEKELSESLKGEYKIESHPYLLHNKTQKLCLLHKITTNSTSNNMHIKQIIEEYQHTKCSSISKLMTWHKLQNSGYCSDQQTFYLIFEGKNNYTLKQEITNRRFYQRQFREDQIRNVIQTYLGGLREYHQRFQREYERLTLESLAVDLTTERINLKDPWLCTMTSAENSQNITQIMQTYPSPQKLAALHSPRISSYNQFLSNLFSVGVISLELKRLDFADSVYTKKRQINHQQLFNRINEFRDPKLRRGIQFLLSMDPNTRKQIFSVWGIENREEHFLVPVSQGEIKKKSSVNVEVKPQQRVVYQPNPSQSDLTQTNRAGYSVRVEEPVKHKPINLPYNQSVVRSTHPIHVPAPTKMYESTRLNVQFNQNKSQSPSQGKVTFQANKTHNFIKNPERIQLPPSQPYRPAQNQPIRSQQMTRSARLPQKGKKFISFRDYLSFNQQKPTSRISPSKPIVFNPPKKVQNRRSQEMTIRSKESSHVNTPIYGSHKESYTYYEHPPSGDQLRKESYQTVTGSPGVKEKPIPSPINQVTKIAENQGDLSPSKSNQTSIIKQKEPLVQLKQQPQVNKSSSFEDQSTHKSPTKQNPHINQADSFLIKQQQSQNQKTPIRPPKKNKFNSTIVEVRDQDTPDHSAKSQEIPEEQQYVVEEYETGSRYEGFKSDGMRNGRGRFYYQDGGYYEGQWKNNKMDGYGKLFYQGGKLAYEGMWSQDQFNGLGKVYNDNPVSFSTAFDYTNFDYLQDFWEFYEGTLSKDTKQGRGRIKLSNGQVFQGDFHEDKIQGFGKFHSLEGKIVEGMWRQSKLIKVINSG